ncbi:Conserved_hypothetical protein [Hexamita inflata]|uniref:Uncharacterized protein n=1 Tax=Hexamita inflata TaxID=28002 RepID=A0AA86RSB3_9EUKA|nr:Conserved hypothetical protein [Hexamita inflata]CAI9977104.1 Conserved hypothetical protein [Hexamita inflata]
MPRSNFASEQAINALKLAISLQLGIQSEIISNETILMQLQNPQFNWNRPAESLNQSGKSLKRWVSESFQRQINQKLTPNDHFLLVQLVQTAINNNLNVYDRQIQVQIYKQLSKTYNWQVFYSAFTNAKQTCINKKDRKKRYHGSCGVFEDVVAQVKSILEKK